MYIQFILVRHKHIDTCTCTLIFVYISRYNETHVQCIMYKCKLCNNLPHQSFFALSSFGLVWTVSSEQPGPSSYAPYPSHAGPAEDHIAAGINVHLDYTLRSIST